MKMQKSVEFDVEMATEEVAAIQPLRKDELNGNGDYMVNVVLDGRELKVSKWWWEEYCCTTGSK